jgi:hypothetical protein
VNIQAKTSPVKAISPAEWQARVDLAAVYRLVAHHGWDDVIYMTPRVQACPDTGGHFCALRLRRNTRQH